MAAFLSTSATVVATPARCPQHARLTQHRRLAVVAQARSEGSHVTFAAKAGSLIALGAALIVSVGAPARLLGVKLPVLDCLTVYIVEPVR